MAKSPPRKSSSTKLVTRGGARTPLKSAISRSARPASKKAAPKQSSDPFARFKKKKEAKPSRENRDRNPEEEKSGRRKPLELDRDSKPARFEKKDKFSPRSDKRTAGNEKSKRPYSDRPRKPSDEPSESPRPKKVITKRAPTKELPVGERYRIAKRLEKKAKLSPPSSPVVESGGKRKPISLPPSGGKGGERVEESKSSKPIRSLTSKPVVRNKEAGTDLSPHENLNIIPPSRGKGGKGAKGSKVIETGERKIRREEAESIPGGRRNAREKKEPVLHKEVGNKRVVASKSSKRKLVSLPPLGGQGGDEGKASKSSGSSESSAGTRLNKYLAHAGIASRRAADTLIMQGHVTVNGVVVQEMGYKVQPDDVVEFKGGKIKPVDKLVYVLLNKPRNVMSTSADERGRKTVLDIIAQKVPERIYPVGRLDRNTSGLILLTNDGELTKKLSHPSHKVPKVYHVTLDKNLSLNDMEAIRMGITLEDGFIKADSLHFVEDMSKRDVQIEMHSGKNRIVRRIFEHLGYEIVKLDRTYYAGLTKKNLPRGFFRPLTKEEIRMLKHFT